MQATQTTEAASVLRTPGSVRTGLGLLTIGELSQRLKIHPVTTRGLYRRKIIPGLKLGHRTLRFDYPAVILALEKINDPALAQAKR